MPRRVCICTGCAACDRPHTYDRDTSPGKQRCAPCQQPVTRQQQQRASRQQRGYGYNHQKLRQQLLEQFVPGQPCTRCGKPITSKNDTQLGHDDNNRSRYNGLEHIKCNEATAGRH